MTKKNFVPEENLEDNKEELTKAIKYLRSLVKKEKFLKVRKDDNFLLRYLRSSHYDPEIAIRKMQTYYSLKHRYREWFVTNETITSFQAELANHAYYVLEDRDRFGKQIYMLKLGLIDISKTTMQIQSQLQDFFLESVLDEEETQKNGLSILVDLKNFPWTLLKWLTPANVCTGVKKIESLPFKKLEFHMVNTSVLINAAIKLIWPFLSERLKENIHFHYENWPSLHEIIDPRHLPQEYGGTKSSLNVEKLLQIIPGSKERLSGNLRLGYVQNPGD